MRRRLHCLIVWHIIVPFNFLCIFYFNPFWMQSQTKKPPFRALVAVFYFSIFVPQATG